MPLVNWAGELVLASWEPLGASLAGCLGPSWVTLGRAILWPLGDHSGACHQLFLALGPSWRGPLGAFLGRSWGAPGCLQSPLGAALGSA